MIVSAEVGKTGIIRATDEDGRMTEIFLDDRGYISRAKTVTITVPDGSNASTGHVVEIVMEYPPDFPKVPIPLRVRVEHVEAIEHGG